MYWPSSCTRPTDRDDDRYVGYGTHPQPGQHDRERPPRPRPRLRSQGGLRPRSGQGADRPARPAEQGGRPDARWFRPWLDFESEAESLHVWELAMVPGLFQVEGYARALIANEPGTTSDQAEERLAARLDRQRLLDRPGPQMMWVVLDEGVLHRPVGGPEVMVEQMRRLLELAESPRVSLQVLPYVAYGTVGLLGSFVVAEMPGEAPPVAYIDSLSTEDRVSDRSEEVKSLICRHGVIRADALSRRESLGLIKEMMRRWTT
ncbi:DUF5753 domain-containing protein [Streptosporangium sp. NPDC004379]|uniref:DUF5753 domain-containing protein n=1 Tax=Streptosporangium sp. NPDC004379 TaxID=3366189 RepID=UPI0036C1B67E